MRIFQLIVMMIAALFLYRSRYRLLNAILAVKILRKYVVRLSMNIPQMRSKILPSLFSNRVEG